MKSGVYGYHSKNRNHISDYVVVIDNKAKIYHAKWYGDLSDTEVWSNGKIIDVSNFSDSVDMILSITNIKWEPVVVFIPTYFKDFPVECALGEHPLLDIQVA